MSHPSPAKLAKEVAAILEADLVMAAQLKEHVKPERLIEILALEAPAPEGVEVDDDPLAIQAALVDCSLKSILTALKTRGVKTDELLANWREAQPIPAQPRAGRR